MNAVPRIAIEDRRLTLSSGGRVLLDLALDAGGRHRILVADPASAQSLVAACEDFPGCGVLPAGGGLLGAATVAENFSLALRYREEPADAADLERELAAALALCGLAPDRQAALARERPMHLGRIERWTLGLARWLLRPPELLVIDRAFAGLARRDTEALVATEAAYHRRHPFRPVLFVDLDGHELPDLPDCRSVARLAESAETA